MRYLYGCGGCDALSPWCACGHAAILEIGPKMRSSSVVLIFGYVWDQRSRDDERRVQTVQMLLLYSNHSLIDDMMPRDPRSWRFDTWPKCRLPALL
jgi:hypothetical protein